MPTIEQIVDVVLTSAADRQLVKGWIVDMSSDNRQRVLAWLTHHWAEDIRKMEWQGAIMSKRTFDYVKYDEKSTHVQMRFKEHFELLESMTHDLLMPGRPTSLVRTKLEEAYMWVGKAIRDAQIEGDRRTKDEPSRSDA